MYSSVGAIAHNVTVIGTTQDGQIKIITLTVLPTFLGFAVSATATAMGTVITIIINATEDATFECQLDSLSPVPCKLNFLNKQCFVACK